MKTPELARRLLNWKVLLAAGALAVAGCSAASGTGSTDPPATAPVPAATNTANGNTSAPGCSPELTVGDTVDPTQGTDLLVVAGVAELANGQDIVRPVYIQEEGTWAVAPLRQIGSTATWEIGKPVSGPVHIFARQVVPPNSKYNACQPSFKMPFQAQDVTITGTVDVSGQTYPSFWNGKQSPTTSPAVAYETDGVVSLPVTSIPSGLELADLGYAA